MMLPMILVAVIGLAGPGEEWTIYAPEGSGWSVSFPGKPVEERHKDEKIDLDSGAAKLTRGHCQYTAVFGLIPKEASDLFSADTLIDMYLKPMLGRDGKKLEDRVVSEGKGSVRQLVIEVTEAGKTLWIKAHIRVVGNRLYALHVSSKVKGEIEGAEAVRFMGSYRVGK